MSGAEATSRLENTGASPGQVDGYEAVDLDVAHCQEECPEQGMIASKRTQPSRAISCSNNYGVLAREVGQGLPILMSCDADCDVTDQNYPLLWWATRVDAASARASKSLARWVSRPPSTLMYLPVHYYEPGGRTFESCWAHQTTPHQALADPGGMERSHVRPSGFPVRTVS